MRDKHSVLPDPDGASRCDIPPSTNLLFNRLAVYISYRGYHLCRPAVHQRRGVVPPLRRVFATRHRARSALLRFAMDVAAISTETHLSHGCANNIRSKRRKFGSEFREL